MKVFNAGEESMLLKVTLEDGSTPILIGHAHGRGHGHETGRATGISGSWLGARFLAAGMILVLVTCLSCNRAESPEAGTRVVVALPQWFYPSEEMPWLERTWQAIRKENPDVVIELRLVPGRTEHVLQKLMVLNASGEGPDLACLKLHWVPQLARRGLLKPLEGLMPDKTWDDLLPALRSSVTLGQQRFMLPYDVGVRVILYRADLFRAAGLPEPVPGWTWNEFVHAAQGLTLDRDGDGTMDQWGLGLPASRSEKSIFQWFPWFWSLGGELIKGEDRAPAITTGPAVQAMQWYRDLAHRYRVTPPNLYSLDQDTVFQGLAGGLFAMSEGGSWELFLLKRLSRHSDHIRVALLPDPGPGKASATLVDGWGFGVLAREPDKRHVLTRILTRLSSSEHQLEKYLEAGSLPPFQPVYEEPGFADDPVAKVFAAAVSRARPLPKTSLLPAITEALEIAMQEILMGGANPAEVLAAQEKRLMKRAGEHDYD